MKKNSFDQAVKTDLKTYDNIRKTETGQEDDYTPNFLLDYVYFKNSYKMIAIDFSKLQELDADPKTLQQINFTANGDRAGNRTMLFIIEEAKKLI